MALNTNVPATFSGDEAVLRISDDFDIVFPDLTNTEKAYEKLEEFMELPETAKIVDDSDDKKK
ncbi:Hypothetical protein Tpal_143 [Trichococcus palustris]|uniref:Uncharacterized protein n=1 Tax=Trichococcus palustris TaxID=140314 RepID=A0A143Y6N6_9LACT|nr:hypothetical protein [Trichococcus palustris]CZQ80990.1 Hypothetical protein Tpal_143 [Trichococcus palustris]SFK63497.1 hypothetical protein SAMN04488076_102148 [Trichococcus palustris]